MITLVLLLPGKHFRFELLAESMEALYGARWTVPSNLTATKVSFTHLILATQPQSQCGLAVTVTCNGFQHLAMSLTCDKSH